MNRFRWYRRARGGRWARVGGLLWGRRWIRVSDDCIERVDEDWRTDLLLRRHGFPMWATFKDCHGGAHRVEALAGFGPDHYVIRVPEEHYGTLVARDAKGLELWDGNLLVAHCSYVNLLGRGIIP